ncbi:MAG: SIR2 family protein [Anaerolineaceae bacterium]|nr:SIR2 family protein [Anaerolineaceae bacterium]
MKETKKLLSRKAMLANHGSFNTLSPVSFMEKLCKDIQEGNLVPIIGDTIRNAHIFDVDEDQDIGILRPLKAKNSENVQSSDINKEFNVTEELAKKWAEEGTYIRDLDEIISYPLNDDVQIARVAQFYALMHNNPIVARREYLVFLKEKLLQIAYQIAQIEDNAEEVVFIEQLHEERYYFSYSDIVAELDFPRFTANRVDPIKTLARLPLKVYITTSYHDFVERELEAAGKHPQSRLCFWNKQLSFDNLAPEHIPQAEYKPSEKCPVVYHLLGMEQYPASMVLSEDDYLELLWALARDKQNENHNGDGIIPPYFETVLNTSSLLLLGYRLHDWDLKILFRGLLRKPREQSSHRGISTAIHIDMDEQPWIKDTVQAKNYIKSFFKQAHIAVEFGDSDEFIADLGREWAKWSGAS